MELDLHWWVRFAHVGAATIVLGGAFLATLVALQATTDEPRDESILAIVEGYEWLFWIAVPVLIATGIGNLGAFGLALPDPAARWGRILTLKLLVLAAMLLLSVVRTLVVVRTLEGVARPSLNAWRWLYGATVVLGLSIVGFAETLAHG